MKLQKAEFTLHPAEVYPAVIAGFTEDDAAYGPILKVLYQTDEGGIVGICSAKYGPKSNLGRLVQAAIGEQPDELDTDNLIGETVMIVVEHQEKEGQTFHRVASVAPYTPPTATKRKAVDPFVSA